MRSRAKGKDLAHEHGVDARRILPPGNQLIGEFIQARDIPNHGWFLGFAVNVHMESVGRGLGRENTRKNDKAPRIGGGKVVNGPPSIGRAGLRLLPDAPVGHDEWRVDLT